MRRNPSRPRFLAEHPLEALQLIAVELDTQPVGLHSLRPLAVLHRTQHAAEGHEILLRHRHAALSHCAASRANHQLKSTRLDARRLLRREDELLHAPARLLEARTAVVRTQACHLRVPSPPPPPLRLEIRVRTAIRCLGVENAHRASARSALARKERFHREHQAHFERRFFPLVRVGVQLNVLGGRQRELLLHLLLLRDLERCQAMRRDIGGRFFQLVVLISSSSDGRRIVHRRRRVRNGLDEERKPAVIRGVGVHLVLLDGQELRARSLDVDALELRSAQVDV